MRRLSLFTIAALIPTTAHAAGSGDGMILLIFLLIVGGIVYFIPWFIAYGSDHRQSVAIFALNLLLGWTLIGWVGALIWALIKPAPPPAPPREPR